MNEGDEIEMLRAEIATLRSRLEMLAMQLQGKGDEVAAGGAGLPIVAIGGGGGGGRAFSYEDGKITNCWYMIGRVTAGAEEVEEPEDGFWKLVVPHGSVSGGYLTTEEEYSSLTQTVVPLFFLENGEITRDYRGMPCIPVRE
jgi:hypothetical protein